VRAAVALSRCLHCRTVEDFIMGEVRALIAAWLSLKMRMAEGKGMRPLQRAAWYAWRDLCIAVISAWNTDKV